MPGRAISNKKQRLWDAFNEARATIKAEAYKLFKEYEDYCLSFSEPRSADTDLLSSRDSFRSLSAMVYSQFQAMMDFDLVWSIQRRLVSRTETTFWTNNSMQAWKDAVELHVRLFFGGLLRDRALRDSFCNCET